VSLYRVVADHCASISLLAGADVITGDVVVLVGVLVMRTGGIASDGDDTFVRYT
jgi:hypothetical protein